MRRLLILVCAVVLVETVFFSALAPLLPHYADSLTLSKSGATRLIDRLVADGLVARVSCSSDARGAEAELTKRGADRLRTAAPTHLRGIAEYFLAPIGQTDLEVIERTMGEVAACAGGRART